jgi:hypothetical protein
MGTVATFATGHSTAGIGIRSRPRLSEYVADWMSGTIVADQRVGADTIIVVGVARAVSVLIAEEYIRGCPHYVAGTITVAAE